MSRYIEGKTVLVTGGAGFIGHHVAGHFSDMGASVHIADRLSYAGKFRNLESLVDKARIWIGDLKNSEFCDKLAAFHFDYVVHMAGNTHVDRAIADPVTFTQDNVVGANQLLKSIQAGGMEKWPRAIIMYSTDEVFGSTPLGMKFDELTPYNPSNAYSASKVGVEGVARSYWNTFHLPVMVVRPCNTYGRRQHPEKAIPRFTMQALRGEPLTVHNDGHGSRDWLHTSDHANAIWAVLDKGTLGESYNLAVEDEHEDLEVAEWICDILGKAPNIQLTPGRPGHDRRYFMDGSKIRALGWKPIVAFEDGLRDTVEWAKDHQDWWDRDDIKVASAVRMVR